MAAAHPFGAFIGCRFKRIGCVRQIKVKEVYTSYYGREISLLTNYVAVLFLYIQFRIRV
jgi:hypothetical protein